jgi:hypothetical protein
MSDISSAGIARAAPGYGKACRKDVLRGVDVPVMPGAAGRAPPAPGGQAQDREQAPARRAGLRRRVPAVDDDQVAAVPFALVLKLTAELTPAAVRDGAGEMTVADHVADREVFDRDEIGGTDQVGTGAVQEVPPGAGAAAPAATAHRTPRKEYQVRVLLQGGQRPVGLRVRRGSALQVPAGLAGGQSAVPHDPDAAERAVQHRLLLVVWVGPAPVCRPHPYRIARVIEKSREPRRTGGCLLVPSCMGHRILPWPEGRGILREAR